MSIEERIAQMQSAGVFPVMLNGEPATDVRIERGMVVVVTRVDRARFTGRVASLVLDEKRGHFHTAETRRYACC